MEKKKIFSLRKTTMGVGSLAIATTLIFGGGEILPGIEGPAHVQAAVESAKNIEVNPTQTMQKGSVVSVDNFSIKPDEERSTGGFVDTELSLTIKNPQPGENFSLRLAVPVKNLETGDEGLKYYNFVANIEGDNIKDVDGNVIGTTSGNTITLSEAVKDAEEVKVNMSASSYIKLKVDSEDDKGEGTYGVGVHAKGSEDGASFLAYNKDFKHTNMEFSSEYNYTMGIPVLRASAYEKYPSGQGAHLFSSINIKGSELINNYDVSKKGDYFTISYHIPEGAYKEDGELYYGLNPESDVEVKLYGKTDLALDGLGDVETFATSEIDNPFEVERLSANESEIVYKFTLTEDLDSVEEESYKRYAFRGGNLLDFAKLVEEFKGDPKVLESITSDSLRFKEGYAPSFKITDRTGEVEKTLNQPKIEATKGVIDSFLKHAENPPAPESEQNCDCDALIKKTDEKIAELNKKIKELNADKDANKDLIDDLTKRVEVLESEKTKLEQGNTDVNININNNNEVVITGGGNKEVVEAEVEEPEEAPEEESKDNEDSNDNAKDENAKDDSKDNAKEESEDKDNQPSDDKNINVDNNNRVTTDKDSSDNKDNADSDKNNTDKNDGAYDGDNIEKPDAPTEDNADKDNNDVDKDADSDNKSNIELENDDVNKGNTDNKSDDINKDGVNKNGVLPDTGAPIAIGGIGALLATALGALGFRRYKNKDEE